MRRHLNTEFSLNKSENLPERSLRGGTRRSAVRRATRTDHTGGSRATVAALWNNSNLDSKQWRPMLGNRKLRRKQRFPFRLRQLSSTDFAVVGPRPCTSNDIASRARARYAPRVVRPARYR